MKDKSVTDILKENPEVANATMVLVKGVFFDAMKEYGNVNLTLGQILECLEGVQETIDEEVGIE